MRVLIDICHPAHVNFLKHTVAKLITKQDEVIITYLKRGKLSDIVKKELNECTHICVGSHSGTTLSIIFNANILKLFSLFKVVHNNKIDLGVSVGSFTLGMASKLLRKPNIQFDDDPERTKNVFLERMTSTELFFPPIVTPKGKIGVIKALKEWAYLSPKYFTPHKAELARYNIDQYEYLFVREVSSGSLNYKNQMENLVSTFADRMPRDLKVILSLEDKSSINQYPSEWILLQEPIKDIHSLMYYSRIVISSGDSMAREGAMLGVPSVYCGVREMAANKVMIKKGMLFHKDVKEVPHFVEGVIDNDIKIQEQDKFRKRLDDEWVDVTEFIIREIKKYG